MAKSNKGGRTPAKRKAKKPAKKAVKKQVKKASKKPAKKSTREALVPRKITAKRATTRAVMVTRAIAKRGTEVEERTTLNTLYILDGSDNEVKVEINAGDAGQTSDMSVNLDGEVLADKISGDFEETSLGTNKQLHGRKLSIVATIADTSRETNLTSLTIHLSGGVAPNDIPLFRTVDEEGDSADYLCVIKFFDPLA